MQQAEQTTSPRGGFLRRMLMGASDVPDDDLTETLFGPSKADPGPSMATGTTPLPARNEDRRIDPPPAVRTRRLRPLKDPLRARPLPGPSDVVDIRPISAPDLETIYFRIDRLEQGVRLIAETLKRCHVDLASAVEAAREQAAQGATGSQVEELVAEAVGPVNAALGRLAESIDGLPHMLVAATDHMTERLDLAHFRFEKRLTSLLGTDGRNGGTAGGSNTTERSNGANGAVAQVAREGIGTANPVKIEEEEPLPARPFELEPVEAPPPPGANHDPVHDISAQIWKLPPGAP
jgi:hypothetical protein